MDNRMRCLDIEFARISARQPANVPGKLDHGHLHAETDAEKRNFVFARVTDRSNFPFATPIAEAARNQNAIGIFEKRVGVFLFDLLRLDAVEIDSNLIGNSSVNQSL